MTTGTIAGGDTARRAGDGMALIRGPVAGDRVALHWDWVCDVLAPEQAERVEAIEAVQRVRLASGVVSA